MTTLTLEVDDQILARAEAGARASGRDVRAELLSKLEELAGQTSSKQLAAVRRLIARAKENPATLDGPMPDREERNAR
jgi:hypothetical protein